MIFKCQTLNFVSKRSLFVSERKNSLKLRSVKWVLICVDETIKWLDTLKDLWII